METDLTAAIETAETSQKRAQWEQVSYNIATPGMVDVTNESYENPAEHQYVVTLDDVTGDAMACTCPHHVHRSAFCKHMAAVETATADGTLDAFHRKRTRRTKTMLHRQSATVTASMASRAGQA